MSNTTPDRWHGAAYAPPTATQQRVNRLMAALASRGVGFAGAREMEVVGRRSGKPHRTAVNLLVHDNQLLLVSVRGHTHWARNVRAAGRLTIRRLRRTEYRAVEVTDTTAKAHILGSYLQRWHWQVASFLPLPVTAQSSLDELAAAADRMPMFALYPTH